MVVGRWSTGVHTHRTDRETGIGWHGMNLLSLWLRTCRVSYAFTDPVYSYNNLHVHVDIYRSVYRQLRSSHIHVHVR